MTFAKIENKTYSFLIRNLLMKTTVVARKIRRCALKVEIVLFHELVTQVVGNLFSDVIKHS